MGEYPLATARLTLLEQAERLKAGARVTAIADAEVPVRLTHGRDYILVKDAVPMSRRQIEARCLGQPIPERCGEKVLNVYFPIKDDSGREVRAGHILFEY